MKMYGHDLSCPLGNIFEMLKNYLKIALRTLRKNMAFTLIKVFGLVVGITTCLLVGLYIHHEFSFDAFHEKADRIVHVAMEYRFGGETVRANVTGTRVAPAFKQDFPEVENAVRVAALKQIVRQDNAVFEEENFYFADSTFFDVFSFPLLRGRADQALTQPNDVVLTESTARKYFGDEDPIGKVLRVGVDRDARITGVMADVPANSQIQPDFVASFISLRAAAPERETWWTANYATYLLLHRPDQAAQLQPKIPGYMRRHSDEHGATGDDYLTFFLTPLLDVHLKSSLPGNFVPNGNIRYVMILGLVALVVLIIGATTYVNLTTASSVERSREVGVFKVVGASRGQLFGQHLGEAAVLTGISLALSFLLARILLPLFNQLFQREIVFEPLLQPAALVAVLLFALFVSLVAGAYPALMIARIQPVGALKGMFKFSQSGVGLRKSLLIFQFSISVFLLICTGFLIYQMHFIQERELGYDREHVLVLPADRQVVESIETIKTEFKQSSQVESVSLLYESPAHIKGGYGIGQTPDDEDGKPVTALPADENFISTVGIRLLAGEPISRIDVERVRAQEQGRDSTSMMSIMINASQAAAFGWAPDEALNRIVNFNGSSVIIKGVMENFHFASLHEPIGNLVVFPSTWGNTILVKLASGETASTLGFLEAKWKELVAHRPFSYHFIDQEIEQMYRAEIQMASLISAGAILAVLITVLGLFAIAALTIKQRTKEIGVRKVLGASVPGIVALVAGDFLKLVGIALVIAAPVAGLAMNRWLEGFAFRVNLSPTVFLAAGLLIGLVAFLTVSVQTIRAASANPVDALRYE